MIKTLHWYISRELAKVTFLALVAFTLVMTVFAIIEPLRKRGLASDQVLALFAYTLPVMVSLTMPVAALFAATIVYGRFSQDNELMACRASGISTVALLKPALALGGLITVASLTLSNFVTPRLAEMGEMAVKANVRGILYHELASQGYCRYGTNILRAESIDPTHDAIGGAVFCDTKRPNDVLMGSASSAHIRFDTYDGETYATIFVVEPAMMRSGSQSIGLEATQPLESLPLPNPMKEKPAFYDWARLQQTLQDTSMHRDIRRGLVIIRRGIAHEMLAEQIHQAVQADKPYDRLSDSMARYIIRAPYSKATGGRVELRSAVVNGKLRKVEVTVKKLPTAPAREDADNPAGPGPASSGNPSTTGAGASSRPSSAPDAGSPDEEVVTADYGFVETVWSPLTNLSQVSIELRDAAGVRVRGLQEGSDESQRRQTWSVGQLVMPSDVAAAAANVQLKDIKDGAYPGNEYIAGLEARVKSNILAEMHGRVAYGASCFLLVAMGAALGLIFRGGQIVSAFAISVVPAAIVIIMVLMGKELICNPGVQAKWWGMAVGLGSIWGGVVALAVANAVIYFRLTRR